MTTDDLITTWTTAKPAPSEPLTAKSLADAIRSITSGPSVTIVGGLDCVRLFARLGVVPACPGAPLLGGIDVHVCHWLPDDFLLVGEESAGGVRLFVYRFRDGELQAYEVMPGYYLYRTWCAIVGRFKRKP